MKASLHYSDMKIDRADHLRRDEKIIHSLWEKPSTVLVPVHQSKSLIDATSNSAVVKTQLQLAEAGLQHNIGSFLGLDGETACFAVDCDEQQAARWSQLDDTTFADLRVYGPLLPGNQAALLAYARGLTYWQRQNPFCSLCGSATQLENAGHMMSCSSASCQKISFPRTDPAVIMLVERVADDGQRYCLLGRSPQWAELVFSTLAGFVEVGETLEAAVTREVYEEAGIVAVNPRYMASQPWPFPQSIMLGFLASATTSDIVIDENELAEARWFTDTEIRTFGDWGDDSNEFKLPRKDSIARHLIDSWCAQENLPE